MDTHVYELLTSLRGKDVYHPDMDAKTLIDTHFPPTVADLVLSLSNISASFYTILLQKAAILKGKAAIDFISMETMFDIGIHKTHQMREVNPNLPQDARGVLIILLVAVYTSSPEYQFEVQVFEEDHVEMTLAGIDRYHRMTSLLGIANELTWPVVATFPQGIIHTMGIPFTATTTVEYLHENSDCRYKLSITRQPPSAGDPFPNIATKPPVRCWPDDVRHIDRYVYANVVTTDAGKQADYLKLLQYCLGMELYSYDQQFQPRVPHYMLGEYLHIIKQPAKHTAALRIALEHRVIGNNKIHAWGDIRNSDDEIAYTVDIKYYMLPEPEFKKRFAHRSITFPADVAVPPMPAVNDLSQTTPFNYSYTIAPFVVAHCAGHFEGYPLVPAYQVLEIFITDAIRWLNAHNDKQPAQEITIAQIESFANAAIPLDVTLTANVQVLQPSRNRYRFTVLLPQLEKPERSYLHTVLDLIIE